MVFQIIRANQKSFGGAEIYLERLSKELDDLGVPYEVIHSKIPKWLSSGLRALLFDWQVRLAKKPDSFYYSLDRVSCADLLRVGDGVHRHYMTIKKGFAWLPLNLIYNAIEEKAFRHAKHLIAISEMVKQNIIDTYAIPEEKISVVYNGISPKTYDIPAARERIAAEFGVGSNEPIILYVGSGYKRKGVYELLRLFATLKSHARLFIVGKEKRMKNYQDLACALGVSDRVVFAGARSNVDDFYAVADIFVFPTHYEPFGNVILEAMNASCAVITTKQCGGGEIISPEYLMENPVDFSIASKIDELLSDSIKLQEVQKWNYNRSLEFSMNKNAEETLNIIRKFLPND